MPAQTRVLESAIKFQFQSVRHAGKPEAGIAGLGVGGGAAKKLLRRHGSAVGVMEAAARGELDGWGANVRRTFGGAALPATAERLRRNLAATSICCDAGVLEPQLAALLERAIERCSAVARENHAPPSGRHTSAAAGQPAEAQAAPSSESEAERARRLAWARPDSRVRWRQVQPHAAALAARLAAAGITHAVQHALPNGCIVDVAVFGSPAAAAAATAAGGSGTAQRAAPSKPTAVMLRAACDLVGQAAVPQSATAAQLKGLLHGRARHHSSLLRQSGWSVLDCSCMTALDEAFDACLLHLIQS